MQIAPAELVVSCGKRRAACRWHAGPRRSLCDGRCTDGATDAKTTLRPVALFAWIQRAHRGVRRHEKHALGRGDNKRSACADLARLFGTRICSARVAARVLRLVKYVQRGQVPAGRADRPRSRDASSPTSAREPSARLRGQASPSPLRAPLFGTRSHRFS